MPVSNPTFFLTREKNRWMTFAKGSIKSRVDANKKSLVSFVSMQDSDIRTRHAGFIAVLCFSYRHWEKLKGNLLLCPPKIY